MKLVTAEEMQGLDQKAITMFGIPGIVLMENAGLQVMAAIQELLVSLEGKRILIFAGKGNNGGDGFVIARHLANRGAEPKVFLLGRPEEIKGDAAANLHILNKMEIKIHPLLAEKDLQRVDIALLHADLLVDAIYGTGFKGSILGIAGEAIRLINSAKKPIVAVDVPSGLETDTGRVLGPCVKATCTVSFGLPKLGLFLDPGARYTGTVKVADISLPHKLIAQSQFKHNLITRDWCQGLLPSRDTGGHKGTFGKVLVVGGSTGMTGAVYLAAEAALRSGAGLVTAAVPASLYPILETKTTEVITCPLPDVDGGYLSEGAVEPVLHLAEKASVVVLGMGLGQHSQSVRWLHRVLPALNRPVVLDADGLNGLIGNTKLLPQMAGPVVVTPHPGEMSRLVGVPVSLVQDNRLKIARQAAAEWKATVVLKGAGTVVANPEGEVYLNTNGNPGMATGGTGDVLAGIIAGLIAQGLEPGYAAGVGVYAHGAAGDEAARVKGQMGLIAGDVLNALPEVWRGLETKL
ncbi:MAG: NAD(P)H-hydrate dehydratase [Bacillota bacterium]